MFYITQNNAYIKSLLILNEGSVWMRWMYCSAVRAA